MNFLDKLKHAVPKAVKNEKIRLEKEVENNVHKDMQFKITHQIITDRLRQIGTYFCCSSFFITKYHIEINPEQKQWIFTGHILFTDIHPDITINFFETYYSVVVTFGGLQGACYSRYQYRGTSANISQESVDDMFISIAVCISKAKAARSSRFKC